MEYHWNEPMPVTKSVARQIGRGGLSGLTIIHINHLVRDILDLNEIFIDLGANLVYVPVIYGDRELPAGLSYPSICAHRTNDGFALYRDFELLGPAPAEFEDAIKAAIQEAFTLGFAQAAAENHEKVIVVEDGGYHFDLVSRLSADRTASKIIGAIEQTKAGVRSARSHVDANGGAQYPILSIARSKLKVRFENYFVARRVVEEVAMLLYELEEYLAFRDVLLIGYGIIGRPMGVLLRKLDCHVVVTDNDPQVQHTATCEGFEVTEKVSRDMFETKPIVLGTTGTPAFTLEMFVEFLKSSSDTLYLVSASSKRVEFSSVIRYLEGTAEYRASRNTRYPILAEIDHIEMVSKPAGLVYSFAYQGQARRVVLLAEGYPVNFYRPQSQSLPSRVIDPINGEILLLVQYLFKNHATLRKQLYLLGHDYLPGLFAEEDELMTLWQANNNVSPSIVSSGVWQALSPHPNERRLVTHG